MLCGTWTLFFEVLAADCLLGKILAKLNCLYDSYSDPYSESALGPVEIPKTQPIPQIALVLHITSFIQKYTTLLF
jgi:hypothetical protein